MSLIRELFNKGIIKEENIAALEFEMKKKGKKEEEFLLEKRIIKEEELFSLKSEILNIPIKAVEVDEVPLETLALIPEETAKYYQMIPLIKKDNYLEVGMTNPEDLKAQEALKFLARQNNFNYRVFLITLTTFNNLLGQYRDLKKEVGQALEELQTELETSLIGSSSQTIDEFARLAEEAPITKIVAVILRQAVDGNASDIHIEPTHDELRIRFRLLGQLHSSILLPLKIHPAVIARIKILANLRIDESRIPQDGRFSTVIGSKQIDFRVSTLPTTLGEKVAIRVLDPLIGMKSFKDLGFSGRNLRALQDAIKKPYGLILSTGPTGSGKSTTLYAILHLLNNDDVNIVSLEDPAEYFIDGVNQSQVMPSIGYDFAQGLRHVLRQDPNIIMVGEIRDNETAFLVIHAALTGHIVLSSLHTNNAIGVIPRMIDMGIEPYLIPSTLNIILAQRLVMQLCNVCKKEIIPKKETKEIIMKELATLPVEAKTEINLKEGFKIWQPTGCKKCNNTGFSGRIGIFEVLIMTPQLADIILKKQALESKVLKEAERQGMITIRQDGILKVLSGLTTIEEIIRVTKE
ncbi:GspE/PulE family protein [Patescibacteria group bacterium]|nr:GspE/PulE family protein [Patescibacteria group bacterium]MBU1877220.1 GspE/PulE family protein [Patescibacteria group bacterium]